MYRGTTPTLICTIPYPTDMIESGYVTISQNGIVRLEKALDDGSVLVDESEIRITLTQKESLALMAGIECQMQVRLKLVGGGAVASSILTFSVNDVLKDGEI